MSKIINSILENKLNEIHNNNEKCEVLIKKIISYNNGDICLYIDKGGNNKRVLLNRWYQQSYPIFLNNAKKFVNSNDAIEQKELLTNLVTNTMSWIAGIPKSSIHDQELIVSINGLSKKISNKSFECSKIVIENKEITLQSRNEPCVSVNDFVCLSNKLINSQNNFTNFPTVTKLMHFINPKIFPIFDTNVRNVLFGKNSKSTPTGKEYICYMQALGDLFMSKEYHPLLKSLTKKVNSSLHHAGYFNNLSELRVIDLILFDESMDS